MILGALAALVVGGCGKGLYTRAGQFHEHDGSGGGESDPQTGTGSGTGGAAGSGTGGTGPGTGGTSSDSRGSNAGSTSASSGVSPRLDAGSDTGSTQFGNYDSATEISNGAAFLSIPKGTLPKGGPYAITLSLVSSDGTLPNYGGAMGPIYSITAQTDFWSDSAVLKIHVPSDLGIPPERVGMAYLDEKSSMWILIQNPDSAYNTNTGDVTGTVAFFRGTRYFAPFESCAKDGQDGGVCRSTLRCMGRACQQ